MRLEYILAGKKHRAYWLEHGERGDPHEFFKEMGHDQRLILHRAILDFADSEKINSDRGRYYSWEYEEIDSEMALFKYKVKKNVERFFAIIHNTNKERRSVIVHGFKSHQGTRTKEASNPRFKKNKEIAEKRAKEYIQWHEGGEKDGND